MIAEKERTAAAEQTPQASPAKKMIRCPHKTGINLNMREKQAGAAMTLAIGGAVIVLLAGIVAKVGVIDQYARLSDAQAEYAQVHQQYTSAQKELERYDEVLTEYRAYSMDWMAGAEEGDTRFVSVNRQQVLDLVETQMMTRGTVNSVQVQDDMAVVSMSGMSLREISEMFSVIEQEPIVKSVELDVAETEKDRPASIMSFSVTIILQGEAAE